MLIGGDQGQNNESITWITNERTAEMAVLFSFITARHDKNFKKLFKLFIVHLYVLVYIGTRVLHVCCLSKFILEQCIRI
jgi:hypothetical protein